MNESGPPNPTKPSLAQVGLDLDDKFLDLICNPVEHSELHSFITLTDSRVD
jgi:hypothetical protein